LHSGSVILLLVEGLAAVGVICKGGKGLLNNDRGDRRSCDEDTITGGILTSCSISLEVRFISVDPEIHRRIKAFDVRGHSGGLCGDGRREPPKVLEDCIINLCGCRDVGFHHRLSDDEDLF
jgi:hypothetical protein